MVGSNRETSREIPMSWTLDTHTESPIKVIEKIDEALSFIDDTQDVLSTIFDNEDHEIFDILKRHSSQLDLHPRDVLDIIKSPRTTIYKDEGDYIAPLSISDGYIDKSVVDSEDELDDSSQDIVPITPLGTSPTDPRRLHKQRRNSLKTPIKPIPETLSITRVTHMVQNLINEAQSAVSTPVSNHTKSNPQSSARKDRKSRLKAPKIELEPKSKTPTEKPPSDQQPESNLDRILSILDIHLSFIILITYLTVKKSLAILGKTIQSSGELLNPEVAQDKKPKIKYYTLPTQSIELTPAKCKDH